MSLFFNVTFHFLVPEARKCLLNLSAFCDLPFSWPPWQDNTEWLKEQFLEISMKARSRRRSNWKVSFLWSLSWITALFGPHSSFCCPHMQNGGVKASCNIPSSCKDCSLPGLGPYLYDIILSLMIYLRFPYTNTAALNIRASTNEFSGAATQSLTHTIIPFPCSNASPAPHSLSLDLFRISACTLRTVHFAPQICSFLLTTNGLTHELRSRRMSLHLKRDSWSPLHGRLSGNRCRWHF